MRKKVAALAVAALLLLATACGVDNKRSVDSNETPVKAGSNCQLLFEGEKVDGFKCTIYTTYKGKKHKIEMTRFCEKLKNMKGCKFDRRG